MGVGREGVGGGGGIRSVNRGGSSSVERREGQECRSRWSPVHSKKTRM